MLPGQSLCQGVAGADFQIPHLFGSQTLQNYKFVICMTYSLSIIVTVVKKLLPPELLQQTVSSSHTLNPLEKGCRGI
jgi:hypothetical protein